MFHQGSVFLLHSSSMTIFIPHFCQDSELTELKDTIDILKAKNTEAQEIIQGALSSPDIAPKGEERANWPQHRQVRTSKNLRFNAQIPSCLLSLSVFEEVSIHRENSSESISSMASAVSHSSMASFKEQEAKKKKKKSWVSSLSTRVLSQWENRNVLFRWRSACLIISTKCVAIVFANNHENLMILFCFVFAKVQLVTTYSNRCCTFPKCHK